MSILTDGKGRPIPKPERSDYSSDLDYLRAYHAYKDLVAEVANTAFDEAFRKAIGKEDQ